MFKLISFLKSIGRLTAAIFFATLGLSIIIYSYSVLESTYIKHKNKKYEVVENWSEDLPPLGLKAKAKTKLVDGYLLAQLEFDGEPVFLTNEYLKNKNKDKDAKLILNFKDGDNFEIFTYPIAISRFSLRMNDKGEYTGLYFQLKEIVDTSTYEKFKSMGFEWTIITEIPKQQTNLSKGTAVEGKLPTSTDHCAPGLTRAERMRRLALNGTIRESAKDSYSAGGKILVFFYDGTVLSCN